MSFKRIATVPISDAMLLHATGPLVFAENASLVSFPRAQDRLPVQTSTPGVNEAVTWFQLLSSESRRFGTRAQLFLEQYTPYRPLSGLVVHLVEREVPIFDEPPPKPADILPLLEIKRIAHFSGFSYLGLSDTATFADAFEKSTQGILAIDTALKELVVLNNHLESAFYEMQKTGARRAYTMALASVNHANNNIPHDTVITMLRELHTGIRLEIDRAMAPLLESYEVRRGEFEVLRTYRLYQAVRRRELQIQQSVLNAFGFDVEVNPRLYKTSESTTAVEEAERLAVERDLSTAALAPRVDHGDDFFTHQVYPRIEDIRGFVRQKCESYFSKVGLDLTRLSSQTSFQGFVKHVVPVLMATQERFFLFAPDADVDRVDQLRQEALAIVTLLTPPDRFSKRDIDWLYQVLPLFDGSLTSETLLAHLETSSYRIGKTVAETHVVVSTHAG